ncbi:MAG TPA: MerR family transcriptional regulator [Candidatus Onthovicinus excrementipullorum]|nr:MerR family transcriptional regulator [Candidatus Onthovicinus excrementipullorum]
MTIAQASQKYGITADTLRYYERIGLLPPVRRVNGIRDYSEADCGWIEFIRCMRGAGVQVEALIEYVALFQQGEATSQARKQILIEQRERLQEKLDQMQATLDRLDQKIEHYEQCERVAEETLRRKAAEQKE